jgi:hypothetical protein
MKRFLLKTANVTSYVVIGAGAIYTLSAMLYGMLPADVTAPIVTALRTNTEVIIPTGISTGVVTGVIATSKIMLKSLNEKLHQSNLSLRLWETDVNSRLNDRFKLQEGLNDIVVAKQNEILKQNEIIIKQNNVRLQFEEVTAVRNINSNLIPQTIKDSYQVARDSLNTLDINYTPITKVVEETIIKEIEIAKPSNKVSW